MTKAYLHKYVVIFKQCDFFQKLSYISLAENGQIVQIQKLKSTFIYEKNYFSIGKPLHLKIFQKTVLIFDS